MQHLRTDQNQDEKMKKSKKAGKKDAKKKKVKVKEFLELVPVCEDSLKNLKKFLVVNKNTLLTT